ENVGSGKDMVEPFLVINSKKMRGDRPEEIVSYYAVAAGQSLRIPRSSDMVLFEVNKNTFACKRSREGDLPLYLDVPFNLGNNVSMTILHSSTEPEFLVFKITDTARAWYDFSW